MVLSRSGNAEGEDFMKNMVPLWFPELLGQQSHWMLVAHVTLAAILGVAESI